jgi:acyl dehydratase
MRIIQGKDELRSLVGQELGISSWVEITQERINAFAEGTGDFQWIHTDPERAAKESPFGTTVAHGYLTLSLIPTLAMEIFAVEGVRFVLNYGLNRVRFPNAVKVGARVRGACSLLECKDVMGGVQLTNKLNIEIEDEVKPACVAETVMRFYFDQDPVAAIRDRKRRGSESTP